MEKYEQFVVKKVPPTIYYLPDFISEEEEKSLLHHVYGAPKPKWTQLLNRRLQNWGGLPHPKGMVPEKIPEWLNTYCKRIGDIGAFEGKMPNHVLANEYLSGQGIMPHLDGPLYYPTVSTITLGSHAVLNFYHPLQETQEESVPEAASSDYASRFLTSVLVEPRSLILVKDDMYNKYLHGIDETSKDNLTSSIANLDITKAKLDDTLERQTRISLTIRVVPKVLKAKILLGHRF